jgi:hypothetical protein
MIDRDPVECRAEIDLPLRHDMTSRAKEHAKKDVRVDAALQVMEDRSFGERRPHVTEGIFGARDQRVGLAGARSANFSATIPPPPLRPLAQIRLTASDLSAPV